MGQDIPTRRFGRTEVQMPVLTCGGMRYQQSWKNLSPEEIEKESQENLEATVRYAVERGIVHIETARGYGTSEMQLGKILPKLDRDRLLIQTKIKPYDTAGEFLEVFETSIGNLGLEYVDFLAIHGINTHELREKCFRKNGTLDAVRRLQKEGRVRFAGFSTHAGPEVVVPAIETGEFDYVNLHWYFVYHPLHWPMLEAAAKQDMGTLIISPNDKGGKLYEPTEKLKQLCEPLTPMQFNGLFCLSRPEVHTLSIGATKPSDYDEHIEAVTRWWDDRIPLSEKIEKRILETMADELGTDWVENWHEGLPEYYDVPGEINVREILRLWTYGKSLDMTAFAKMRYNLLGNAEHWFPGRQAGDLDQYDLSSVLKRNRFAEKIPSILAEAHRLFFAEPEKRISDSE